MIKSSLERDEAAAVKFRQKVEAAIAEHRRQWRRLLRIHLVGGGSGLLAASAVERLISHDVSLMINCFLIGTLSATAGRNIKKSWITVLETIDVQDRRLIGPAAEMILNGRKDMRRVAEHTARRLLPKTRAEQGAALSSAATEGILTILRDVPTATQAEAALNLLSYRHEEHPLEVALQYAMAPGTFMDARVPLAEIQKVQAAAKRASASIQANREVYREQSTLLRPAGEDELTLLRPAASSNVPEDQLLRSIGSNDE